MTEDLAVPPRLRAGRIALIAAALAAIGLLVSVQTPTTLNLLWFVVLLACLGVSFVRLRHDWPVAKVSRGALSPDARIARAALVKNQEKDKDSAAAFLSSVGHDLRQPLQAISLYAATLATHPLPDASRQLVGGLEAAAETLSVQFEEVMAIAKLESDRIPLDPKPVTLGAIFSSTVAVHLDEAHDKSLHLRHVGSHLRVWADEALLARAVDRLVAHAVQTTERGGVLVGCRRHGDMIWLQVRDTSGGIAPELQADVFKPFSSYGQRFTDRGLGLALAERIVRRLGGTLTLRSVSGRGNIYTISLPRLTGAVPG